MKIEELEIPDRSEAVLEILREQDYPISKSELLEEVRDEYGLKLSNKELSEAIEKLKKRGYDIKKIVAQDEEKIVLVRYGKDTSRDEIYRPLGKIETPILLSGDFHIGHKAFTEQGFNQLLDDIDDFDINSVILVGDILQGLGVHRLEAKDIVEPDIDSQVDMGIDYLSQIPDDVDILTTIGNHEQKLKGKHKIGFDAVKAMAHRIDNMSYFGSVAEFTLNDEYRYIMLHGYGGRAYSRSYKPQKIWRSLPSPRPDLVHIGHYHILQPVPMAPNRLLIVSGTLQRESSYEIWRGMTTQVGYWILQDYSDEGYELKIRLPETF